MAKHIEYIVPIDYMRGNLSGRQEMTYNGGRAYDSIAQGQSAGATNYQPRLIAKVLRLGRVDMRRFYQVRTRSTVNMSADYRNNVAVMGAALSMYASIVRSGGALLISLQAGYAGEVRSVTFRSWVISFLRVGLTVKAATIDIGGFAQIINPWVAGGTGAVVNVPANIITKFADILSL